MTETLATRMAQAIDHQTLVEMAVARVAAMFPYHPGSGDQTDYAYASAQCLAELMDIVRNGYDDVESGIAGWLSTPPTEWYACDGDVRFDISSLVHDDADLVNEWENMIETMWDDI